MYKKILNKLENAKKPIVFIGNGVRLSSSEKILYEILEKLQVPILTTWRSMDLFEENYYLYCGRPGCIGQRGANTTVQICDFLLCLGTRLDLASVAFDYKNFAPKAIKIIVDIDEAEIDKLDFPKIKIVDDLFSFLHNLNNYLIDNDIHYENPEWLCTCKELHKQPIETIKSGDLSLYEFIERLSPHLKNRVIAVGSSGCISEVFCQSFKVQEGCRVIQSNGLGSMGFGLPAAIGAHYASGKPVVCLDGDGSFALNMQELGLISGVELPILMFVINNGGYVSIKNTQDNICGQRKLGVDWSTGLYLPDYFNVARCFDIQYRAISNKSECNSLSEFCQNINRPAIIEVYTSHTHKTQCRTTTVKQPDGTLKASGLENLWP